LPFHFKSQNYTVLVQVILQKQQPLPPWSSPLPSSLLEELRNSVEWSPPSMLGSGSVAYTAKHSLAPPASLSSSALPASHALPQTSPPQPPLPDGPFEAAPVGVTAAAAAVGGATIASTAEPAPALHSPPQPLSPSSTSKAVATAVAAVAAAVAALSPIAQMEISVGGTRAISGGGVSAVSVGATSAISGGRTSDPALHLSDPVAPVSAHKAATTGGTGSEPLRAPHPSLLHKFASVGGGSLLQSDLSAFSGFSTPSLSTAASNAPPASATPAFTPEVGQPSHGGGTAGGGAGYSNGGAPGSAYSGYAVTPPGSVLTATPADLDRLRDDILSGLREMLLDVVMRPGSLPPAPPGAGERARVASGASASSAAAADAGGGGALEDLRGSVRLSREDLEDFLFDKQVR